jgi:hypothetical protein
MNTSATVEWEFYDTWPRAVADYYPRYSARGIVRSLFTVNVGCYPIVALQYMLTTVYQFYYHIKYLFC